MNKLLIANRGEIAIRIIRAAAEMGLETVAVYATDDAHALHVSKADEALALQSTGVPAYLDIEQLIAQAQAANCDAIHPGYGFLSENADFARRCQETGIRFVGPRPEILALFGDKSRARAQAIASDLPILPGTGTPTTLAEAGEFLASLGTQGAIMIKAIAGGGGRGMRIVTAADQLADAFARCQSEAQAAFGNGDLYVEQYLLSSRHIEVQVVGDGSGAVNHLGERECTVQRRHQKLVEIAPSPTLTPDLRQQLTGAAMRLAADVQYDNIGTVEFLLNTADSRFFFLEVNPRLQVEHTVTDEVMGTDLVKIQLQLARGKSLEALGLDAANGPSPHGMAMQLRVNMETITADGSVKPSVGTLTAFEPPTGFGLRVDTFGYTGYAPSPRFDSLLAKVIATTPSGNFSDLIRRSYRALAEFHVAGVETNIPFLQSVLQHPDFIANRIDTRFVETALDDLLLRAADQQQLYFEETAVSTSATQASTTEQPIPEGSLAVTSPLPGVIVTVESEIEAQVHTGQPLIIIEAMKMETVIHAPIGGLVQQIAVREGDVVQEGQTLLYLQATEGEEAEIAATEEINLDHIRPDLAEVLARHEIGLDAARPEAVAKRHRRGQRTARENIADLCDPDSFIEYGALVIAAQRQRRSLDDLIANTPADGLIAGVGSVNGHLFDEKTARCFVSAYDYTVLAGTQGMQNHHKLDRLLELAGKWQLPLVIFSEGGGGRPGETEGLGVTGLDLMSFNLFSRLKGHIPLVNITSGRCFAGNAVIPGLCDVVIATENANIGMAGPAMIEGGGLGVYRPEEIGPVNVQADNGVIDIVTADETTAVQIAKKYLAYFQGSLLEWDCADQRHLRNAIPENRLRVYDIRALIELLADTDSVLELRRAHAPGMVTALARIEGQPVGIVANNPQVLAGAITTDGAYKAARFMDLCNTFGIPLLSLCDTPGFMVGPETEQTGLVKAAGQLFITSAQVTAPLVTIVLRKCYGLGAMAMAGGTLKAPFFTVAWPSGEFGAMGLEGFVRLGYRRELDAVTDPDERQALYEKLVAQLYDQGKALSIATYFEIDDVIDPMTSRSWITKALRSLPNRRTF